MNGCPDEVAIVLDAIRRVVRAVRLSAQAAQQHLGISAAQLFVLEQLADTPAASLGDLAARTLTDRSAVSLVVTRLVAHGLVERKPAAEDRRRWTIALTPRGRALLRRAPRAPTSQLLSALERMPRRDLRSLAREMRKLTRALGLMEEPASMLFEDAPAPRRRRSPAPRRPR